MYAALARMSNVRRICEIGFNGGHSASLWLWANPTAEVVMFDLWEHEASPLGEKFLLSDEARSLGIVDAASRLKIVKGNSLRSVTQFSAENPSTKCDLLSVDGGHSYEVALADIAHMHNLANPRFNTMLVDDTQCTAGQRVRFARPRSR
jgi:predicted O-methyltransferase YrrM